MQVCEPLASRAKGPTHLTPQEARPRDLEYTTRRAVHVAERPLTGDDALTGRAARRHPNSGRDVSRSTRSGAPVPTVVLLAPVAVVFGRARRASTHRWGSSCRQGSLCGVALP
jgi:hypothetical protein